MFALPKAVSGQMAMPRVVVRHPLAEQAEQVQAAREMDAAYARARVLMQDLAAMRRRATAIWN